MSRDRFTAPMPVPDELLLLRSLVRSVDYGVLLSDADRRDLICNDRFYEIFDLEDVGPPPFEAGYMRTRVLTRLKDPDGFMRSLEAIYADPLLVCEDEIELCAPKYRLLRRYSAPVQIEDGTVVGRVWTFLDITQTRRLEDKVKLQASQLQLQARTLAVALKSANGRLNKAETVLSQTQQQLFESEKLSAVGLLATSVAHDIRNMLTPLTIELTLADHSERAAQRESFDMMRQQIDRMSLLTHRLLALARPVAMEHARVDLATLVSRTVELLTPQAAMENVKIETRIGHTLPYVAGDPVQLDQVLVNLALNGVQAMHPDGGILQFNLRRKNNGVCLRVADTGRGIPPKARRHLFDPFYTTRPDGAGLGLFSCRRIVEAHNGTIRVRSIAGQGTQFYVWLPSGEFSNGG